MMKPIPPKREWLKKIKRPKFERSPAFQMRQITRDLGIYVDTIVELGVYKGGHAEKLRYCFPEARLFLVDAWRHLWASGPMMTANPTDSDWQEIYMDVCKMFDGDKRTKILRMMVEHAPERFENGSCDLVYIDADHRYESVKRDIFDWLPKVRNGGIIAGHDYKPRGGGKGVFKAVNEIFGEGCFYIGHNRLWLVVKGAK